MLDETPPHSEMRLQMPELIFICVLTAREEKIDQRLHGARESLPVVHNLMDNNFVIYNVSI